MKINVYTYDDPKTWVKHSKYNKIKNAIHICATKNMADGIKEAYQSERDFCYVFTIREIIEQLLLRWNSPEEQLKQYLKLSRVISEYETDKLELKDAFKKSKSDLIETIRLLTYTGVKPDDLSAIDLEGKILTEKEKLFHQIWDELEKKDSTYKSIRNQLYRGWSTEEVKRVLNKLLMEQDKIERTLDFNINQIVLHGFYFITPEQQVFLQMFGKAGFEITFFNYYDKRFPETFDFTRAFISEKFQWTDAWKIESTREEQKSSLGFKFLSAFEGKNISDCMFNHEVIGYESFFEFLNEVIIPNYPIKITKPEREDIDNVQIIATNADMLNDILVQYYPERFAERRSILQYPIGQFISKIHQMIDENDIILNADILISTFSSGWLYNPVTKENAREYTYLLKKILPFFGDCRTVQSEWLPRFSQLLNYYEEILPAFEEPGDNRIVTSVRNPFASFGHFSLTRNEVENILYFVKQLIYIGEELFITGARQTSISKHFEKLLSILEKRNPTLHSELLPNEVKIITQLSEKLKQIQDDNFFLYEDVGEAINVYLSGKLSNKDESFIKPFIEVDGEAFRKNTSIYHLTGLDNRGLPLDEFSTPWPLQEDVFEKLSLRHEVLELSTLRNKSVKQISRYLFFIAIEFLPLKNMELSWMKNFLDRKDLQPAIYIHQLGLDILDYKERKSEHKIKPRPNNVDFKKIKTDLLDSNHLKELMFKDYLMEYQQCPKRFYNSYILSSSPVFINEFFHQFMYTDLIRLVKQTTPLKNSEIIEMVGKLFPQWTDYKKRTIAATYINSAGKKEVLEEVSENVMVSKTRLKFQFPGMNNNDRKSLLKETNKQESFLISSVKDALMNETDLPANPGTYCRICPYLDTCSEGKYSIDKR